MSSQSELISIIVPVYNTERYLKNCINSILSQSYENFELILVDDGSSDGSGKICDQLAQKDHRIVVIHKTNGGQSSARNLGIEKAKGDLLTFVDSDDFIHKDFLKRMIDCMIQTDSQIVQCRLRSVFHYSGDLLCADNLSSRFECFTGKGAVLNKNYKVSPCAKIYRRFLFDDIRFPVGYIFEDEATYYKFAMKCSKICMIPDELYFYYQSENSTMRSSKFSFDFIKVCEDRIEFCRRSGDPELINYAYERFGIILLLKYCIGLRKGIPQTDLDYIRQKYMENYGNINFGPVRLRNQILLKFFRIQPSLCAKLLCLVWR